jgi:hypothetical protein
MRTKVVLGLVLILALALPGVVSADTGYPECTGEDVTGVVVAVDETTGEITLLTGAGTFCTLVKRTGEYDHPVIDLLGEFFEKVSLEELAEDAATNLENLQAWVVCDPLDPAVCVFGEETDLGAFSSTVVGVEDLGGGLYEITILVEGVLQTFTTDDPGSYQDILENIKVTFGLVTDKDGNTFLNDGADQIGAYHDDGMGLGVLVKLFAMSDAFGIPVEELIARFNDGEGLGQLFKDEFLGKPDYLGVGHVFKELGKNPGHPEGKTKPNKPDKPDKSNKGKGH